jgi:catechol 2,3-dioxygenase-like lactoylglutathione lyase family enzyme
VTTAGKDARLGHADYDGERPSGLGFHVGLNVPDMEQALAFYQGLLGLDLSWRHFVSGPVLEEITGIPDAKADVVQLLCPGGSRIELTAYVPTGRRTPASQNDVGLTHLSFGVKDVEGVQERLEAAGVKFASRPLPITGPDHPLEGWTVTYLSDPFGTTLELLGRTRG